MNTRRVSIPVLGLLLAQAVTAAESHVATTGSDANPGTVAQPLATLQAGVNKLQPGDTLRIHGGVYRETVTFPRNGTADKPITVRAAPGKKAVVTGCEPVTGWTLHDAAKKPWKAPLPWTLGQGRNQVFCDGKVLIEARFPNQPAPGLELPVAGLDPMWPTYGEFSIPDRKQHRRIVSILLEGQPDDYWKGAMYCGFHFEGCRERNYADHRGQRRRLVRLQACHRVVFPCLQPRTGGGRRLRPARAGAKHGCWPTASPPARTLSRSPPPMRRRTRVTCWARV